MIVICETITQGMQYCRDNDLNIGTTNIISYRTSRAEDLMGLELREDNCVIIDPFIETLLSRMRP